MADKKKVFITGATGFIGGWCAEAFTLSGRFDVVAGIRTWSKAARIARFGVPLRQFDLLKPDTIGPAIEGCSHIVHAAVGDDQATIEGTRNLFEAAVEVGVKKIVHISSVAVFGGQDGEINEASLMRSDTPYGERKKVSEDIAASYKDRLEVIILRPTIVYGPFSDQWTLNFSQRLRSGKWGLFGEGGEGYCNLVYVGDLVRAIELSLNTSLGPIADFNINGPDKITWNDFFQQFSTALGTGKLQNISLSRVRLRAAVLKPVRLLGLFVLSRYKKQLILLTKTIGMADFLLRKTESELKTTPTPEQLSLYQVKVFFDGTKAAKELGFVPKTSAEKGLNLAAAWVKHHGIL
jgi:nucleoside-diphosphate-sugar epimerase